MLCPRCPVRTPGLPICVGRTARERTDVDDGCGEAYLWPKTARRLFNAEEAAESLLAGLLVRNVGNMLGVSVWPRG
jgi:hypothetical protein